MRRAAAAATVLLAAAASAARGADEGGLLLPGDSVRTTLGAGERKTIAFAGVAGTSLDLRVKVPRGRGVPRVTLLDPSGTAASTGPATPDVDRSARIDVAVHATGVWRIALDSPTAGTLTLTTRASPPVRLAWVGTGAAPSVRTFDAAPGGSVSVAVDAAGEPALELLAPSGQLVARVVSRRGRVVIAHAALTELGRYSIRIDGAAGGFDARAIVRPATPRRRRFRDVESPADVRGFSPATAPNQSVAAVLLDGTGFTNLQTLAVVGGGEVVASAPLRTGAAPGASALLDLESVPPGAYSLEVRQPGRPPAPVTGAFAVTNLPPKLASFGADVGPNTGEIPLSVVGSGFDDDAQVVVRPAGGAAPLAVAVAQRTGHESIAVSVTPPPYFTGPCDVEVRDPDGGSGVLAGALDVLGYRSAPAAVATATDAAAVPPLGLVDAAYDETRGRVLAAFRREAGRATFVLLDATTLAPLDTLDVAASDVGGERFDDVQVAWDGAGDTFAICLTNSGSPVRAVVRIVPASDIHGTVAQHDLAAPEAIAVSRVHAASDRDDGGYLVVWDQFDAVYGSRILARPVDAAGELSASAPSTLAWDVDGDIGHPTVAYQGGGRFVVAWAGLSEDRLAYAVRITLTDAAGATLPGTAPRIAATSRQWSSVARPGLAVNRADGSTLLTYSYGDGAIFRPGARGIAPGTGTPLVTAQLDAGLDFPGGVPGHAVWNAARGEFVVATVGYDARVAVRRVAADGTLRPSAVVELYEGASAVPYAGAAPGTLGLLRVTDADDDGLLDQESSTRRALAGPLR